MIDKEKISKLLEIAVHAPSGDNSQPWRFEITEKKIDIYNLPEKDNPLFNYKQRGSFIAHGCLIENIALLAPNFGYKVETVIFPEPLNKNHIATILFTNAQNSFNPLSAFITSRSTNRKFYKNTIFSEETKKYLLEDKDIIPNVKLILVETQDEKQKVGRAVSMNEVVMLEEPAINKSFFNSIVWSENEEKIKKSGLYLKTLEFNPIQTLLFKLIRNQSLSKLLNKIGLAKFIAKQNSKLYSTGSALGAIIVKDDDRYFIEAGRLLQKFWLKSISKDLSIQPLAGIIYFAQQVENGLTKNFSTEHVRIIKEAYDELKNIYKVSDGIIAMVFRVGQSEKPTAVSTKKLPDLSFLN